MLLEVFTFKGQMEKLKEVLDVVYGDILLSRENKIDDLCESAIPKLEHYLEKGIIQGRRYLVQEQNRLLSPDVETYRNLEREMIEILQKVFHEIKPLADKGAPHFYESEGLYLGENAWYDSATMKGSYSEEVHDYVDARLRGENPHTPWRWYSMQHLSASMLMLEIMEQVLHDLASIDKHQTKEKINLLAQEAYLRFKEEHETVRRNCLSAWKDELGDKLPTNAFINEKTKELKEECSNKELMNLAHNYFGDYNELISQMKGKYGYKELLEIFMFYFKKEVLLSLQNNKLEKIDIDKKEIKEKLKNSIIKLQEETISLTGKAEEYLFNLGSHWIGVFRVLADKGLFNPTDYKGFTKYMMDLNDGTFRIPCEYSAIKNISRNIYHKSFSEWKYDCVYNKQYEPYERMKSVVIRYQELFQSHFSL